MKHSKIMTKTLSLVVVVVVLLSMMMMPTSVRAVNITRETLSTTDRITIIVSCSLLLITAIAGLVVLYFCCCKGAVKGGGGGHKKKPSSQTKSKEHHNASKFGHGRGGDNDDSSMPESNVASPKIDRHNSFNPRALPSKFTPAVKKVPTKELVKKSPPHPPIQQKNSDGKLLNIDTLRRAVDL